MAMMNIEALREFLEQVGRQDRIGDEEALELVSRSVREDLKPQPPTASLATRLRGIARLEAPAPTDDGLQNDYVTYLEQKYS